VIAVRRSTSINLAMRLLTSIWFAKIEPSTTSFPLYIIRSIGLATRTPEEGLSTLEYRRMLCVVSATENLGACSTHDQFGLCHSPIPRNAVWTPFASYSRITQPWFPMPLGYDPPRRIMPETL